MASRALSISALMAGVTLMLVALVLVIFWALRRRRAGGDADQQRDTTVMDGGAKGLSTHELETLTGHDFLSNGAAAADCAVCLEAFEAGDRCRRLPRCDHSFHAKCVGPWLEKSRCCPVCRADVVVVAERPTGELVKVAGEGETTPALTLERRSPAALEIVVRLAAV